MSIPDVMTALVADRHGPDAVAQLRVARIPVPALRRGQVLVRMRAAPCNPADLMYIEGRYGITRPLPATPGFEGAGEVVASGGGMLARYQLGRRVATGGHECSGTWAEYCVAEANQCLPLARGLSFEQGAAALANPTTALALLRVIAAGGHRAYVQTAAAGQLGRMIVVAGRERGIPGIHIVRRAAQADAVRAAGGEHVLISEDPDFDRQLAERAAQLGATIALDAIAGDMTGRLLAALPRGGEVVIYGALSAQPSGGIDPMGLAFGAKRIRGFEVATYIRELGLFRAIRLARAAQDRVRRGVMTTEIARRVPLADAPPELAGYATRMSEGKVLITMA
jgi:NADPH2:quinone reductase